VRDRAELLVKYDYVTVSALPADVRQAFIAEHSATQQIANELIVFLRADCGIGW
jgi:hypothetical protein